MSEAQQDHPDGDELVELALGDLAPAAEAPLLAHVRACAPCRATYDGVVRAVDTTLPASPAVAPLAGFDARVLDRVGMRDAAPQQPGARRVLLFAAAASVAGLLVGGGAVLAIRDPGPPPAARASDGTALLTSAGTSVGTVLRGHYEGQDVLVMHIQAGVPGRHYTCRFRLADGSARSAGDWTVPASGTTVWIASEPSGVTEVELVTDSGTVWSRAGVTQ